MQNTGFGLPGLLGEQGGEEARALIKTTSMDTALRDRQAHADHARTHGTCVTCTTVASETDT